MPANHWRLNARSEVASPDWESYAARFGALMRAAENQLGGLVWRLPTSSGFGRGPELRSDDLGRLHRLLEDRQLRNDSDEVVPGGGSHPFLIGQRTLPHGDSEVHLKPSFGETALPNGPSDRPVFVLLEVTEPPGCTLWSSPDEAVADLVAQVMQATAASEAKLRDDPLHRLVAKADQPVLKRVGTRVTTYRALRRVGSHVFLHRPLDMATVPPGTRQVPCGSGTLLIVPPGPHDDDTLERMRWVATVLDQDQPPKS